MGGGSRVAALVTALVYHRAQGSPFQSGLVCARLPGSRNVGLLLVCSPALGGPLSLGPDVVAGLAWVSIQMRYLKGGVVRSHPATVKTILCVSTEV